MSVLFRNVRSAVIGISQFTTGHIRQLSVMSNEIKDETEKKDEKVYRRKEDTRYFRRMKRRNWEDGSSEEVKKRMLDGTPFVRIKKRKIVMLLGYAGANYFGMQRNPGIISVEEEFMKALLKAEYITLEQYGEMHELHFQRAARTDKGVSAVRQIISMKFDPNIDISKINEYLPQDIRIFGLKRVTKGFDAKRNCNARTYTYTLPTYALERHSVEIEDHRAYRTTTEKISEMNHILENYKGCKNYHNYTVRLLFNNAQAKRFITDFSCDKVFEADGMEFAVLKVQGQSFVMHQIRKMVGVALAIIRGFTTIETLHKTFTSEIFDIPTAPGLGLVLDYVHYDRYNKMYGKDGIHSVLTWEEEEEEVEKFKKDFIYPSIISKEVLEKPMASWLPNLCRHKYAPRAEHNDTSPDGVEDPGSDLEDNDIDNDEDENEDVEENKNEIVTAS